MMVLFSARTARQKGNIVIDTARINLAQVKLVKDIIAYFDAKSGVDETTRKRYDAHLYLRKELREAHKAITGKIAAPFFISKNKMAKGIKQSKDAPYGSYRVNFFLEYAAKHPPTESTPSPSMSKGKTKGDVPAAEAPAAKPKAAKAKKEAKPKPAAKAKKEKAPKKEQPAPEPAAEQAPSDEPTGDAVAELMTDTSNE